MGGATERLRSTIQSMRSSPLLAPASSLITTETCFGIRCRLFISRLAVVFWLVVSLVIPNPAVGVSLGQYGVQGT